MLYRRFLLCFIDVDVGCALSTIFAVLYRRFLLCFINVDVDVGCALSVSMVTIWLALSIDGSIERSALVVVGSRWICAVDQCRLGCS